MTIRDDDSMTWSELTEKVKAGGIIPLSAKEWDDLSGNAEIVERHATQLAGDLLIVRLGEALAAVESPSRDARVIRLLAGPEEARSFVAKRLEEYERMWDGCGVKVDYLGGH